MRGETAGCAYARIIALAQHVQRLSANGSVGQTHNSFGKCRVEVPTDSWTQCGIVMTRL